MPTTDSNGIIRYLASDGAPTPPVLNLGMQSVSDALSGLRRLPFYKVANTAERAGYVAAQSSPPSNASPLFVYRLDAVPGQEIEYTTNGTTWRSPGQTVGARVQIGNGSIPPGTARVLGPAATLLSSSPGFTRVGVGIQVPTEGLYTISAHQSISGTAATGRIFIDFTLSATPLGYTSGYSYRVAATNENYLSGSVQLALPANTQIGIIGFHSASANRSFDGYLTVTGNSLPIGW